MRPVQHTAIIAITAIFVLIALVIILSQINGNQLTGAPAFFYEPTYCLYEEGVTTLECACGKGKISKGGSFRFRDLEGRAAKIQGDYCLMRHQRDLCYELCKYHAQALANMVSVASPTGQRANLLEVQEFIRPNYYAGHQARAKLGAYSYVSGR